MTSHVVPRRLDAEIGLAHAIVIKLINLGAVHPSRGQRIGNAILA
jgi:hypothetical protein